MFPILFNIGGLQVPAYGVILALDFLLCLYLLRREAVRMELDPQKTGDAALASLLFGLIGAKLLLILIDLPYYLSEPGAILGTLRSAGVIYGGQIGGLLGVLWYVRRHKLPLWTTIDTMAPMLALGIGLGRLACFMAGCCYGQPHEGFLAVHFPDHAYCEAPANIGLFPIQLVSFVNGVVLFFILRTLLRRRSFKGQIILAFFILYGLTRGTIELFRGDGVRGLWFGETLSTSQLVALITVVLSAVLYWRQRKASHAT